MKYSYEYKKCALNYVTREIARNTSWSIREMLAACDKMRRKVDICPAIQYP